MPTVSRFEDLDIWQLARQQCNSVSELIEDGRFDFDSPLADEINRATASVMDNIAQGFDRFSRSDFRHFLTVAKGFNAASRSQIHRAEDRRYILPDECRKLLDASASLSMKISNLINHLHTADRPPQHQADVREQEISYAHPNDAGYNLPRDFVEKAE